MGRHCSSADGSTARWATRCIPWHGSAGCPGGSVRSSTRPTCPSKAGTTGTCLTAQASSGACSIRSRSRVRRQARSCDASRSLPGPSWPGYRPSRRTDGGSHSGVTPQACPSLGIVSADGSRLHRLADWVDRGTVSWSARGDAIYFFRRVSGGVDFMKVRIDLALRPPDRPPVLVMDRVPFYAN